MERWAKLILFFVTFYTLFGLYLTIQTGAPNGTNDFIFHYSKARNDFSVEAQEYYSQETFDTYPSLIHSLTGVFAINKFTYFLLFVLIIMGLMPYLLFKLAGEKAVIVYFLGISLPHMALYSAVYASMFIMVYFLIYLLNRKNIILWIFLTILSFFTHRHGIYLFLIIGVVELICYFMPEKQKLALGVLGGQTLFSPYTLFEIFIYHTNIFLIWFARKNFDLFYGLLFIISFLGTTRDFRIINIAQIILCIVLAKNDFDRKTWILLILLCCWNVFNFCYGTARFLY